MPEGMKEKEMIDLLLKRFIKDYDKTKNPEVRTRYGVFAGIVGIICNLILFLAKIIAGVLTASVSIMAESAGSVMEKWIISWMWNLFMGTTVRWRMQSITYRMQDLQLLHL